ncbi:hypothetical protein TVAG_108970 [Trichomonas vaginalis G3]|uniref:Uncharacterized protein n=1 Tax=Trichomonas vaginalis (strain ATCC PRA-98 / G3) TaxID=412133 RepID=A2F038_TRIV3|nr:hypothetical protein TVAGG3_0373960 [Trichomonas vaginalis G3]EAY01740.1 hypothetical protein TVAG_108970 [Trichomonas vaginalis G3]KAI5532805.1 hypothetical protein TVAGG3_0373960 [Trichomonas vaginalis G3]|eukprot:XP_001314298.1 hypothetical protein [Trichomonas vaginalis G3]
MSKSRESLSSRKSSKSSGRLSSKFDFDLPSAGSQDMKNQSEIKKDKIENNDEDSYGYSYSDDINFDNEDSEGHDVFNVKTHSTKENTSSDIVFRTDERIRTESKFTASLHSDSIFPKNDTKKFDAEKMQEPPPLKLTYMDDSSYSDEDDFGNDTTRNDIRYHKPEWNFPLKRIPRNNDEGLYDTLTNCFNIKNIVTQLKRTA